MNPFADLKLILAFAGGLAVCTLLWTVWDRVVDDPQVRTVERAALVSKAEHEALKARLEEITRQRLAAQVALEEYRKRLATIQAENKNVLATLEQEIADYEARSSEQGRLCPLSPADIDWLRK